MVLASAGDIPTKEALAAADMLRAGVPRSEDPLRQRGGPVQAPAGDASIRTGSLTATSTLSSRWTSRSSSHSTGTRG